jgi:hypothetical protein
MSGQSGSLPEYVVGKKTIPFGAEEQEPSCNIESQSKKNEIQAGQAPQQASSGLIDDFGRLD